ncbi:unnamed protein product [Protopolystoma xenopodis]|uniref:Uncharacterized protein n=1 Tax=Protopolystoma xenopodis TaxID=117903 RepID=A0A448WRD3_9PLAT|nr:unnamed protein product [Protopolystoma xenopodis]
MAWQNKVGLSYLSSSNFERCYNRQQVCWQHQSLSICHERTRSKAIGTFVYLIISGILGMGLDTKAVLFSAPAGFKPASAYPSHPEDISCRNYYLIGPFLDPMAVLPSDGDCEETVVRTSLPGMLENLWVVIVITFVD